MLRVCLAWFVLTLATPTVALASPLHVDGPWIKDADGGVVVLRGINAAGNSKVPPFRPLTDPDSFYLPSTWGMNVVRLLFNWEAYEPHKGVYDESYLDYYEDVVSDAEAWGLYVVVDFHQDAYSRFSLGGCGEGLPGWTLPWWIIKSTPKNDASCSTWGATMIIDVVMHLSWGAFHRNDTGARDRYLAMVKRVASRLASHDNVIAYDMMNEPWGDEPTELFRLYEDAAKSIRSAHPDAILFVSPHALISAGGKSGLKKPTFGNFLYSPHFYDAAVVTLHVWFGNDLGGPFDNMRSVAKAWNVPLFVGEFGGNANTSNGHGYVAENYDELDETFASGAQWSYTPGWTPEHKDGWNDEDLSIVDGHGNTRATFVHRAYPRRIAGEPGHFFASSSVVEISWTHDAATGETEVYIPSEYFGMPGMTWATEQEDLDCSLLDQRLRCSSSVDGPKLVTVYGI